MTDIRALLQRTAELASDFLESLDERPVFPHVSVDELQESLRVPLPEDPTDPAQVIEQLARAAEPGLVAMPSGRYFGFVIGGGLQAARRRARSTPARSIPSRRSPTQPGNTGPGCTSTARSDCGRPRARGSATSCAAPNAPTRGSPTRTNGSTCPTTPRWVLCADAEAHRAAMTISASYLIQDDARVVRDQVDWVPEFSRRARGFAVYAALRSLGRRGLAELVERTCACARRRAVQAPAQAPAR